jgi:hypothetical protein
MMITLLKLFVSFYCKTILENWPHGSMLRFLPKQFGKNIADFGTQPCRYIHTYICNFLKKRQA